MLDTHSVVNGGIFPHPKEGILFPLSQIWRKLRPLPPVDAPDSSNAKQEKQVCFNVVLKGFIHMVRPINCL